jgi:Uma2 family endonuclease
MLAYMLDAVFDPALVEPGRIRPLSRREYDRLVDLGWFENERIELLRGTLVTMSPQNRLHAAAIVFFTEQLVLQLAGRFEVRVQLPFAADDLSEPEPDFAVARKDPLRRDHPEHVLLIIEIADSSLRIDRGLKRAIYAEAKVPEYWIVDVSRRAVDVHLRPVGNDYADVRTLRDGELLRPTLLPDVAIAIAEMPR